MLPSYKLEKPTPDLIILTGQSNIEGAGDTASLDNAYRNAVPHSRIFAWHGADGANTSGFIPLQAGVSGISAQGRYNGPEIGIGFQWYEETGRDLYIIKYGRGGKHVANDDLDNSFYPVDGAIYAEMLECLAAGFGLLSAQGIVPGSLSIINWQGESDCTEDYSSAFAQNKEYEVESIIAWLVSEGHWALPNIPVVLTQIYMETGNEYIDTVRAGAVTAAAALGNAVTVDAAEIVTLLDDNIHADANTGAYDMGVAMADAAIALLQAQGTLP